MLQFIHPNTENVSKDLFSALAHKADVVLAVTIAIAILQMALKGVETSWMLLLTGSLSSIIVLTGLDRGGSSCARWLAQLSSLLLWYLPVLCRRLWSFYAVVRQLQHFGSRAGYCLLRCW